MRHHFKKIASVMAVCFLAMNANAQLLRLHVADSHTIDNMSVTWSPDYDALDEEMCELNDDGNGNYTFDANMPEKFNWMYLEVFGSNRPLVVEQGKTIDVTVTGGSAPSYKIIGENREASLYIKQLDMAFTEGKLKGALPQLRSQLEKVEPEDARQFAGRITDMYETYEKIKALGGSNSENALYNIGSTEYDKALADVKVNDPVYLRYRLNERVIRNQMSKDDYGDGKDLTNYGLKFMEKMKAAGITNALVKHSLLDHLASLVIYQSQPIDASIFLHALAEYASEDKPLLEKYHAE